MKDLKNLLPLLKSLPENRKVPFTVDLDRALSGAGQVWQRLESLGVFEQMRELPEHLFDAKQITLLPKLSRAVALADSQVSTRQAGTRRIKLPTELVEDADALRRRMRGVLAFYLQTDPDVTTALASMGTSNGYLEMAGELRDYATLYGQNEEALKAAAGAFYDPKDAERAWTLYGEILQRYENVVDGDLGRWLDVRARAWSLWHHTYTDVAECARFLLRGRPERQEVKTAQSLGRRRSRTTLDPVPLADELPPVLASDGESDEGTTVEAPLVPTAWLSAPSL